MCPLTVAPHRASIQPRLANEGGSAFVKFALLEAACTASAGERPRGAAAGLGSSNEPPPEVAGGLADMAADFLAQAEGERAASRRAAGPPSTAAGDCDALSEPVIVLVSRCPVRGLSQ